MKKCWLVASLVLSACASANQGGGEDHIGDVRFVDSRGAPAGDATLFAVDGGVRVVARVSGLTEGKQYGFHIHSVAQCNPPNFESAGAHFNPTGKQHGRLNPGGPHLGDLPNIERQTTIITVPGIQVIGQGGLFDHDGASLVVHMHPDDLKTDPSGNSGARMYCGVIVPR